MGSLFRRSAELILLGVFLSGFLITVGLLGDFGRSFSNGLSREPVPAGPFLTDRVAPNTVDQSLLTEKNARDPMVVWISNPDSDWEGLISGLRRQNLPFRLAHEREDLDADVILVYPTFSGKALPEGIYQHILRKVQSGSVLITQNVESELGPRFGFRKARFSMEESMICVDAGVPQCKNQSENSSSLRFETPNGEIISFETMGYLGAKHPLTHFGSGDAALIMNSFGKGSLYAFGLDLGSIVRQSLGLGLPIKLISESQSGDLTSWIYDQIQTIYLRSGTRQPLIKKSNLAKRAGLISHEIRTEKDLLEAARWAAIESRLGVKALYIIDYGFLKAMTPDLWISPLTKAQLASISKLGHPIGLGWLKGSPPLDALEKGTGGEFIQWTDDAGARYHPTFPSSQTGVLRISRQVLEQGYGVRPIDTFITDQELIPIAFARALQESGFRYLSRSGFEPEGLDLPMVLQTSEDQVSDHDLMILPSRIHLMGLNQPEPSSSRVSMRLLDIPLGSEDKNQIEGFFDQLRMNLELTELDIYRERLQALAKQKSLLERTKNKYELVIESPIDLGSSTIDLPVGLRNLYRLPRKCPNRLEVEVFKGEQRVEVCRFSRTRYFRKIRVNPPKLID